LGAPSQVLVFVDVLLTTLVDDDIGFDTPVDVTDELVLVLVGAPPVPVLSVSSLEHPAQTPAAISASALRIRSVLMMRTSPSKGYPSTNVSSRFDLNWLRRASATRLP
jgi:hypothetical protein